MTTTDPKRRIVILGAGGRDFHNFLTLYRDDDGTHVLAFTATQIPGIADRQFPASLAGTRYPEGIPIIEEDQLEQFCLDRDVDDVIMAYSDLRHDEVMHLASRSIAAGARFVIPGARETMLHSQKPVIAVSAVRTGCGKSQTTRHLSQHLRQRSLQNVLVRHPMPYGNLAQQAVQRFETIEELTEADCTIEEREEYEPHIRAGTVVYAGVDYGAILARAETEADVILWDGGNNDFPFFRPDLHIVIVDALRPGQLTTHHPGEAVLRMADIVVINKVHAAEDGVVDAMSEEISRLLPDKPIVRAASPARVERPEDIHGKRVIIIEDGPTITHGGMGFGAGFAAVRDLPDVDIIDPRSSADPDIAVVYEKFPHIGSVLPAMGYSDAQRQSLSRTINGSNADIVVAATPADISQTLDIEKPVVRVSYDYDDADRPYITEFVDSFLDDRGLGSKSRLAR
jgi:predicted GTPase